MSAQAHTDIERPVLIDTSAWIEASDPEGDPTCRARVLELIESLQAATCEVVIAEVLRGADDDLEAAEMEEELRGLEVLPCDGMGKTAAGMGRALRAPRGRLADLLIAAVAFEARAGILTRDSHLSRIAAAYSIEEIAF